MAAGTLTLTCLLLAVGQAPAEPFAANQRTMKIPFLIEPARRQDISQLILYVSTDRGQTWNPERVIAPDQDGFPFFAPQDGEYWFRVASKNHQGQQEPENIFNGPHTQKILVDTLKPGLRLLPGQRQGDEIPVQWEIQEDHPDLGSLKLFQRQGDTPTGPWVPVNVSPALIGNTSIRVVGPGAVSLRLECKDLAGNLSFAQADVPAADGFTRAGFNAEAAAGTPSPAPPVPTPPAPLPPPVAPPLPPPVTTPLPAPAAAGFAAGPVPPPIARHGRLPEAGPTFEVIASSKSQSVPLPGLPEGPLAAPVPRSLPPVQVVNSTELWMQYELAKVGPSGISKVELYLTQDDGKNWKAYADDPKLESVAAGGRFRVERLPGEGVYGFAMVALSKAGRGRRPPQPGDLPEMRVEVDLTPPEVELAKPIPDPERPNCLLLRWACRDRNLTSNGVTLDWAERRDGPWQPIAADLASTAGRYSWELPRGLPVYLFLRLRVRDNAGNEGVVVTNEPQLSDLSEPAIRMLSVTTPQRQP